MMTTINGLARIDNQYIFLAKLMEFIIFYLRKPRMRMREAVKKIN
jgi:hypothetical protein